MGAPTTDTSAEDEGHATFVAFEAPADEDGSGAEDVFLGYWHFQGEDGVYVYGSLLVTQGDVGRAILALQTDLGVDIEPMLLQDARLAEFVAAAQAEGPVALADWSLATRETVMILAGLWVEGEYGDGDPPPPPLVVATPPCLPCAAADAGSGATAGEGDPMNAPVSSDVYAAAVGASCGCCNWDPCPNCNDGNACTRDSCEVRCSGGYCSHKSKSCDDDVPCTNDFCNPNNGVCQHPPKTCQDNSDCTFDRCNVNAGNCEFLPHCDDRTCCPTGSSHYCCNVGENICCPTNPAYADHCCEPGETCCGAGCCNADQMCCNDLCGTKGACCFFDTGSCAQLTSTCCLQQGGTYQGNGTTCSPPDLCRPKCENCHSVTLVMWECGHYISDPLGPCAQDECFELLMDTASCDSFPYRKGPAKCNTYEILGEPEIVSKSYPLSIPEICEAFDPGGFHPWQELYFGCGEACDLKPNPPAGVRCDTGPCGGSYFVGGDEPRGAKKACGCPPP